MEVMRDCAGNGIVICSIENLDAMGVHTGDSITVAPAPDALRTREHAEAARLPRSPSCEKVGVATGGSNVQFAVNPEDGRTRRRRDEPARVAAPRRSPPRPRASRSPRWRPRLAVGLTLDEVTQRHHAAQPPACFEPSIDYCVVKMPRFTFEKFQGTDDELTTSHEEPWARPWPLAGLSRRSLQTRACVRWKSARTCSASAATSAPRMPSRDVRQRVSSVRPTRPAHVLRHPSGYACRGFTLEEHPRTSRCIDPWYLQPDQGNSRIWKGDPRLR